MVVEPSIHPEGRLYRWTSPDGFELGVRHFVESDQDFAMLPEKWIEYLTHGHQPFVPRAQADLTDEETRTELAAWFRASEKPCEHMRGLAERHGAALGGAGATGVHPAGRPASLAIVGAGREGHAGVLTVLEQLRSVFVALPRNRNLAREWRDLVAGAVRIVVAGTAPPTEDPCEWFEETDLSTTNGKLRAIWRMRGGQP
jgi:hypothetical protein